MNHENIYFKHMKEIEDTEWLTEILSERFDNAIDMLTSKSVIYGGAVRDVLAGKEPQGDLDVAVLPEDHSEIVSTFLGHPRWKAQKPSSSNHKDYFGKLSAEPLTLSKISSFVNTNGVVVQLIVTADTEKDRMQAALWPARRVDIICCGVVMLTDGRVFEVVPGALEDCKNSVLNINKNIPICIETLSRRINKLVSRGWTNSIDLDKLNKELKKTERKKPKKKELPTKRPMAKLFTERRSTFDKIGKKKSLAPSEWITNHVFTFGSGELLNKVHPANYATEVSRETVDIIGVESITDLLEQCCRKYKFSCRFTLNSRGVSIIECTSHSSAILIEKKLKNMRQLCSSPKIESEPGILKFDPDILGSKTSDQNIYGELQTVDISSKAVLEEKYSFSWPEKELSSIEDMYKTTSKSIPSDWKTWIQ